MKYLLLIPTFLLFSFYSFGQEQKEDSFQQQMKEMELQLNEAMKSLNEAFGDSRLQWEQLDLGKTDQEGQLRMGGDTLDMGQIFQLFDGQLGEIPLLGEDLKNDEYWNGIKENSLMLPDLLLKSSELLENSDIQSMFEELMRQLNENGDLFQAAPKKKEGKVKTI